MNALEQQILDALQSTSGEDSRVTVTELARQCRADAKLVLRSARQLIDAGRAEPAMVDVYGVPTLYGLVLRHTPAALRSPSGPVRHS